MTSKMSPWYETNKQPLHKAKWRYGSILVIQALAQNLSSYKEVTCRVGREIYLFNLNGVLCLWAKSQTEKQENNKQRKQRKIQY